MTSTTMNDLRRGEKPEAAPPPSYEGLKRQLEGSKHEFLPLLGNMGNVDAFVRVVLNAVMANPDLITANRRSLIAACMKAAMDGLMPDGRESVLNVYNTKVKDANGRETWVRMAQYLPMVGGMVKSMYESGQVSMVDAAAVYEKDRFLFRRGDTPVLEHEPTLGDEPGRVIAAYVVVRLTSGEVKREVMPRRDIEAVRAVSKSGDGASSPWTKWYDQQAIKSVIKRSAKQLPRMDRLDRQISHDNEALGIAAGQGGIGDIVTDRTAAAAPAVDSLAYDPSPTMADLTGGEVVQDAQPKERMPAQKPARARAKDQAAPAPAPAADAQAEPQAQRSDSDRPTFDQLAQAMEMAPDRDAGDEILDRGRELDDLQREELARRYETRFPD